MMNSMESSSTGTRCPVCGMEIDEKSARRVEYKGQTYFVASDDCKRRFLMDPAKYAGKAADSSSASSHGHHVEDPARGSGGHGCC